MRILVTGASGLIGSNLVDKLSEKHKIVALVRRVGDKKRFGRNKSIEFVLGDINKAEDMKKIFRRKFDVVIHLAALLPKKSSRKDDYWRTNFEATRSIYDLCQEKKLLQFIYFSTAFVDWEVGKQTIYEESKKKAEDWLKRQISKKSVPITILKPGFVYGNCKVGIYSLIELAKKNRLFLVNGGNHDFEMIHIDDVVNYVKKVLGRKKYFNKSYVLSEEKPLKFKEIVRIIKVELKQDAEIRNVPGPLFKVLVYCFEFGGRVFGLVPPITFDTYKTLTANRKFDVSETRNFLGLPMIKTQDGVVACVRWYINEK